MPDADAGCGSGPLPGNPDVIVLRYRGVSNYELTYKGTGVATWAANYPAALALRDALPGVRTMDVLYRTPVCFSTTSKDMFVGW